MISSPDPLSGADWHSVILDLTFVLNLVLVIVASVEGGEGEVLSLSALRFG